MQLFFLEQVHASFPQCRISVITTRNTALLREMAALYPYIAVQPFTMAAVARLALHSAGARSVFVVPPTFYDVPWFVRLLAQILTVPRGRIAGFTAKRTTMHFSIAIPFEAKALYYQNFSALLRVLGCMPGDVPRPALPQDMSVLRELGTADYIVLAPFAAGASRSLPEERWVSLFAHLSRRYPAMPLVVLGGPADTEKAERIAKQSNHRAVRIFCGIPFAQTAALISHAKLFIGVDSGLTHVAGVLQRPSVIIGNLSNPTWLPSYNAQAVILTESRHCLCTGEKNKDCFYEIGGVRYLRCMIDIDDQDIYGAIDRTLTHYGN